MIQDILTYITVTWAFWQVLRFFYRLLKPIKGQSACSSGACSCDAKSDLFKAIQKGKYPTIIK